MGAGSGASERRACCSRRRHCSLRSGYSRSLPASNLLLQHPGLNPGRQHHRAALRALGGGEHPPPASPAPQEPSARSSPPPALPVRAPTPPGAAPCSAPGTPSSSVRPPPRDSAASRGRARPGAGPTAGRCLSFPTCKPSGLSRDPAASLCAPPALPPFTFPRSAPPRPAGLPDWHPINRELIKADYHPPAASCLPFFLPEQHMGTGSTAPAARGPSGKDPPHTTHPLTVLGHLLGSPAVGTAATTPQNTVLGKLSHPGCPPARNVPRVPHTGWDLLLGPGSHRSTKPSSWHSFGAQKRDGSSTDDESGDLGEVREGDRAVPAPGPLPGRGPYLFSSTRSPRARSRTGR